MAVNHIHSCQGCMHDCVFISLHLHWSRLSAFTISSAIFSSILTLHWSLFQACFWDRWELSVSHPTILPLWSSHLCSLHWHTSFDPVYIPVIILHYLSPTLDPSFLAMLRLCICWLSHWIGDYKLPVHCFQTMLVSPELH